MHCSTSTSLNWKVLKANWCKIGLFKCKQKINGGMKELMSWVKATWQWKPKGAGNNSGVMTPLSLAFKTRHVDSTNYWVALCLEKTSQGWKVTCSITVTVSGCTESPVKVSKALDCLHILFEETSGFQSAECLDYIYEYKNVWVKILSLSSID